MLVGAEVNALELNGVCIGNKSVASVPTPTYKVEYASSTDKYRFHDGKVFHEFEGRKEYYYNKIRVSPFNPNHFISGHMKFVFDKKGPAYVVVATKLFWKVIYLDCTISW